MTVDTCDPLRNDNILTIDNWESQSNPNNYSFPSTKSGMGQQSPAVHNDNNMNSDVNEKEKWQHTYMIDPKLLSEKLKLNSR